MWNEGIARLPQPLVLKIHRWNSIGEGEIIVHLVEAGKWVQITRTIRPNDWGLGDEILHRKNKWIKFNGTPIITSKFAHRY
jgi:hypothetical protein